MAKNSSFPITLIAPVVQAELNKSKDTSASGKNTTRKTRIVLFNQYLKVTILFMAGFTGVIYLGWINWPVIFVFVFISLAVNIFYIFKMFQKADSIVLSEAGFIDWQAVLSNQVMVPTSSSNAQPGSSEDFFSVYLSKYFDGIVFTGESFSIPNSERKYSSDFSIVTPENISIIVEIDEPYYYIDGTPTHCKDRDQDKNRNNFFLSGGWSIIRFAEEQIVTNPEGCCYEIARFIYKLTRDKRYLKKFGSSILPLEAIQHWSFSEAEIMAKGKYRDDYLIKGGIKNGKGISR